MDTIEQRVLALSGQDVLVVHGSMLPAQTMVGPTVRQCHAGSDEWQSTPWVLQFVLYMAIYVPISNLKEAKDIVQRRMKQMPYSAPRRGCAERFRRCSQSTRLKLLAKRRESKNSD
jgi:hypothetical protein